MASPHGSCIAAGSGDLNHPLRRTAEACSTLTGPRIQPSIAPVRTSLRGNRVAEAAEKYRHLPDTPAPAIPSPLWGGAGVGVPPPHRRLSGLAVYRVQKRHRRHAIAPTPTPAPP